MPNGALLSSLPHLLASPSNPDFPLDPYPTRPFDLVLLNQILPIVGGLEEVHLSLSTDPNLKLTSPNSYSIPKRNSNSSTNTNTLTNNTN